MLCDYLRPGDYRKVLKYLETLDPLAKAWVKAVHLLVRHTIIEWKDAFFCFSYFKDNYQPEQVKAMFHLIQSGSIIFNYATAQRFLAIACSTKSGVDAQVKAIKICCKEFDNREKKFANQQFESFDHFRSVNIKSVTPVSFKGLLNFGIAKQPVRYRFFTVTSVDVAAPIGTPYSNKCDLCGDSARMHVSDHQCKCTSPHSHYGCFRLWYNTVGDPMCPWCRTPHTIPKNKLVDDIFRTEITGSVNQNMAANIKKMDRPNTTLKSDPRDMLNAYKRCMVALDVGPKFNPPDLRKLETWDMNYPQDSKAGLYFNTKQTTQDEKYTFNPTKKAVFDRCRMRNVNRLRQYDHMFTSRSLTRWSMEELIFGATVSKPSFKVEVKKVDDTVSNEELAKLDANARNALVAPRTFFMPTMRKFLADKIMCFPGFQYRYDRGPIMPGFEWAKGGAAKLFRWLKGTLPSEIPTHYFFEWDLKGMDQSVKAMQIIMNLLMFLCDYHGATLDNKEMETEMYILKMLLFWSADNSAVHDVKWFSQRMWKRVIGILFSGEYFTSMSQTITSFVVFLAFLFCNRRLLKEEIAKLPEDNKTRQVYGAQLMILEDYIRNTIAKFFGDDGIAGIPLALVRILVLSKSLREKSGLARPYNWIVTFEDYLKYHCDMELKVSDSGEFKHLYTVVEDDEIIIMGPKILKRHFRVMRMGKLDPENPISVVAFRECHLWKIATPVIEHMTYSLQVLRIIGAIWDTMGNNTRQYNMLVEMLNYTLAKVPGSTTYRHFYMQYKLRKPWGSCPRQEKEFLDRLKRLQGGKFDKNLNVDYFMEEVPSIEKLQYFFDKPSYTFVPNPVPYSWDWYQRQNKT